jgi:hypothetical protein
LDRATRFQAPSPENQAALQRAFLFRCRSSAHAVSRLRGFLADEFRIHGISKWTEAAVLDFISNRFKAHILAARAIPRKSHAPSVPRKEDEPEWEPLEEFRPNNEPAVSMRTLVEVEDPPGMETHAELDEGPEMDTESAIEDPRNDTEGDSEILDEYRSSPPEYAEDAEDAEDMASHEVGEESDELEEEEA